MSRARFVVLSIVVDAVVVNVGFVVAFLVRFQGSLPAFNFDAYLLLSPFLTLFFIGGAWTYGLYDPERADTSWAVARGVIAAVTVGTILTAAIAFFGSTRTASFARSTILLAWAFDLVLLTGWRLAFLRFGRLRWPEQRVLIVGTDDASIELAEEMSRRERWGWKVVGLIDTSREPGREPSGTAGRLPHPRRCARRGSRRRRLRGHARHRRESDPPARTGRVACPGERSPECGSTWCPSCTRSSSAQSTPSSGTCR